jgi:hypothetical protein
MYQCVMPARLTRKQSGICFDGFLLLPLSAHAVIASASPPPIECQAQKSDVLQRCVEVSHRLAQKEIKFYLRIVTARRRRRRYLNRVSILRGGGSWLAMALTSTSHVSASM